MNTVKSLVLAIAIYLCLIVIVYFLIISITSLRVKNEEDAISSFSNYQRFLEPNEAINLDDPPFYQDPLPETLYPIRTVIEEGIEIPIFYIYNDDYWKRQAYKSYWHSSYHRWSYAPNRIHYAMHRIFATYPTASIYYDFIHDLGIADVSISFKDYPKDDPYSQIEVAIMQSEIHNIYSYENQIVIVSSPKPTGLKVVTIPVEYIKPFASDKSILIQLATRVDDEIDYCTIKLIAEGKSE
ncbi:hypothetical protein [Alkaliphilus serpentinus]|uniref:Uncharacterized protein n=1 Tax=Alkaliphilus serpentinus TaxID=1482731 RepID=A0A833HLF7_9FIRM|nr:hypothetical protein [Alkaliphilus serpentinus]KAB3525740.1 hypothetical protein F8153_14655 [Alkaliphilus serpentinus]